MHPQTHVELAYWIFQERERLMQEKEDRVGNGRLLVNRFGHWLVRLGTKLQTVAPSPNARQQHSGDITPQSIH